MPVSDAALPVQKPPVDAALTVPHHVAMLSPVTAELAGRLCPNCGQATPLPQCPRDGTATLRLSALATAHNQLLPGQLVAGKYRIVGEIARGGHGVVYRAEHLLGLGTVALKLPRRESTDVDALRRFFREAQVSAKLSGRHTARVLDVGQTEDGALYLALEFVEGQTLDGLLKSLHEPTPVLTEPEVTRIALEILDGLDEAHEAGLVHRDLKPSNIALRASDGAVKILDFGLASVEDSSLTPSERALGTPEYMSPEQCQGLDVDGRSDLYALGVVMFRAVVGHTPFRADSAMTVMWGHVHKPPPDVAMVALQPLSPQFDQVVMRALAKKPEHRFASALAMKRALLGEVVLGPMRREVELPPIVEVARSVSTPNADVTTISTTAVAVDARPSRARWMWAVAGLALVLIAIAGYGYSAAARAGRAEPALSALTPPASGTTSALSALTPPASRAAPLPLKMGEGPDIASFPLARFSGRGDADAPAPAGEAAGVRAAQAQAALARTTAPTPPKRRTRSQLAPAPAPAPALPAGEPAEPTDWKTQFIPK